MPCFFGGLGCVARRRWREEVQAEHQMSLLVEYFGEDGVGEFIVEDAGLA